MSFYGSVYYQLIDTFYKIIVKNSGDKTYTFNDKPFNPSDTPESEIIESPAVGRKGVFSLNSGNYWIDFSKSDSIDEAAPYKVWHSPAHDDPNTSKRVSSWDIESHLYTSEKDERGSEIRVLNKDGVEMVAGEDYIQLADHEFLRMYPSHYDEAGHVIDNQTESILYRLPKSDVNERVDYIEQILGEPQEHLKFPRPDISYDDIYQLEVEGKQYEGEDFITSVTDYAEKNYEDIKDLEKYVGDWKTIYTPWGVGGWGAPTVTDVIGVVETMFSDGSVTDYQNYNDFGKKSFSEIIGNLPAMWRRVSVSGNADFISLSSVIIAILDSIDAFKAAIERDQSLIKEVIAAHGTRLDGHDEEIIDLWGEAEDIRESFADEDALIRQELANEASAIRGEMSTMNTDIRKDFGEADETIRGEMATMNTNIRKDFGDADGVLDAKIDSTAATLRGEASAMEDSIRKDFDDADGVLDGKIDSTAEAIRGEIKTTDESIRKDFAAADNVVRLEFKAADEALEGKINGDVNTKLGVINNNITDLQNSIGAVQESHAKDIDELRTALNGTDNTESVVARLDAHDSDIEDLQKELGSTSDEVTSTIYGKINANTKKFESYATTAVVEALSNQMTNNYALKSETATKEEIKAYDTIASVDGKIKALADQIGPTDSLEGQTVISLLLELSN
jgi:hypothetical protein